MGMNEKKKYKKEALKYYLNDCLENPKINFVVDRNKICLRVTIFFSSFPHLPWPLAFFISLPEIYYQNTRSPFFFYSYVGEEY